MAQLTTTGSEAAILSRLIRPDRGDFSPQAAREILDIRFGEADQTRMRELSAKAQDGTLTESEQAEVEHYRRVGYWLGLLWSKARLSLRHAGSEVLVEGRT